MKKIIFLICFFIALKSITNRSFAQNGHHRDTIYYLVDTLHTPVPDRMLSIATVSPHQFYTIKCPCLSSNNLPVFRGNISLFTSMSKIDMEKIKLIYLPNLIELVRKNDDSNFEKRFILFFITKAGESYQKLQVHFLGGKETKIQ